MRSAKAPLVLAGALLLAGCSPGGNYEQFYEAFKQSLNGQFGRDISRDQAAAIPYASMGVKLGSGPEYLIVLASDSNGDQLWTSKSHIVLSTRDGRIRRTVGLMHDLTALAPHSAGDLPSPASALKGPIVTMASADFADIPAYAVTLTCRLQAQRAETIVILGKGITTMRVDETCRSDKLDWRYTNRYWLDPESGFVWRTVQHVHPKTDPIFTEIFRPPG